MPSAPISTRLTDWLDDALRQEFRRHREGPAHGLRRVVEEWWAMEHLPAIEFRNTLGGRRAALRGGPEIWEIMMVRQDYPGDLNGFREHFAPVPAEHIDQAIRFHERFPELIDELIAENERVGRYLEEKLA